MPGGVRVTQRFLEPLFEVRILAGQPKRLARMRSPRVRQAPEARRTPTCRGPEGRDRRRRTSNPRRAAKKAGENENPGFEIKDKA